MSESKGVIYAIILALSAGVFTGYLIFIPLGCAGKSSEGKSVLIRTDTIVKPVRIKEQILIPQYFEKIRVIRDTILKDSIIVIGEKEAAEYAAQADTIIEENGCHFEVSFISSEPLNRESYFTVSVDCPPVVTGISELIQDNKRRAGNGGFIERISLGAFIGYGLSLTDKKVTYAPFAGIGIGIRILP